MKSQSSIYSNRKVVELKKLLHKRKLPVSGIKAVLINRLEVNDQKSVPKTIKPITSTLTGVEDADIQILLTLDDESLYGICLVDHYASELCKKDKFWIIRISNVFGKEVIKYKPEHLSFRKQYETLSKPYDPIFAAENGRVDIFIAYSPEGVDIDLLSSVSTKAVSHNNINILEWLDDNNQLLSYDVGLNGLLYNNINVLNWLRESMQKFGIPDAVVFEGLQIKALGNKKLDALKWLRSYGFTHTSKDIDRRIAIMRPEAVSINTLRWVMKVGPRPTFKGANRLLLSGNSGLRRLEILLKAGIFPDQHSINIAARTQSLKALELLVSYDVRPERHVIEEVSKRNTIEGKWVKTNLL